MDCTAGAGGHAALIAERIGAGRLIAMDRDAEAVALARRRLASYTGVTVVQRNYDELSDLLAELEVTAVDGILVDAGLSSMQLDNACRGFGFQAEGPLDMRMDAGRGDTAATWLSTVTEAELERVLKTYGDVGPARRIARTIATRASMGKMNTTLDLVNAVADALNRVRDVPLETRTVFQAIRIAVNRELESLEKLIGQAIERLAPTGRIVAISFHSGEDRVVKNVLRDAARTQRELSLDGRVLRTIPGVLRILTPKPVTPSLDEIRRNPRASSARLRAAERLA